jgi:hypothetical protein
MRMSSNWACTGIIASPPTRPTIHPPTLPRHRDSQRIESPSLPGPRCPDYPIHRSTLKAESWTIQCQPAPAERDRSAASLGSDHQNPQRAARKPHPPQSFLSARRTGPAEPPTNTPSGGSVTTTPWDGLGYAAFLQNAPVVRRTRGFTPGWYTVPRWGTLNASPAPSLPASGGPIPRSPQYAQRSGIGPQRALEAITKAPRAKRESLILPRASSASEGPIPRSISTLAHGQRRPLTLRAPCRIGASL